jgi:hypothetical protein
MIYFAYCLLSTSVYLQFGGTIGRIYFVGPSGGERFYLRLLLTVVKDPTSFEDFCTFEGVLYVTFKSACIAHGLLDSDEQLDRSLIEAALWKSGSQLWELFVRILFTVILRILRNHGWIMRNLCLMIVPINYE